MLFIFLIAMQRFLFFFFFFLFINDTHHLAFAAFALHTEVVQMNCITWKHSKRGGPW